MGSETRVSDEQKNRIIAAADGLFEEGDRKRTPTVKMVRKAVGIDIHVVSAVMRGWRKSKERFSSPTESIPDELIELNLRGLSSVWSKAEDIANESLNAARRGWSVERAELETSIEDLENAYQLLVEKIERLETEAVELERSHLDALKVLSDKANRLRSDLVKAMTQVGVEKELLRLARTEVGEAQRHAAELERQVEVLRKHNEELLASIQPVQ